VRWAEREGQPITRRYGLRDDPWERIQDLLRGRKETVGVTAKDNRLFVDAGFVPLSAGHLVAGSAGTLRRLSGGARTLQPLGEKRRLGEAFQTLGRGRRQRIGPDRQHDRACASAPHESAKKGAKTKLSGAAGVG